MNFSLLKTLLFGSNNHALLKSSLQCNDTITPKMLVVRSSRALQQNWYYQMESSYIIYSYTDVSHYCNDTLWFSGKREIISRPKKQGLCFIFLERLWALIVRLFNSCLILPHFTQFSFCLVSMDKKIRWDFRGSLKVLANMPFLKYITMDMNGWVVLKHFLYYSYIILFWVHTQSTWVSIQITQWADCSTIWGSYPNKK